MAERQAAVKEAIAYLVENAPYTAFQGYYRLTAVQGTVRNWAPEGEFWPLGHQFEQVWLNT